MKRTLSLLMLLAITCCFLPLFTSCNIEGGEKENEGEVLYIYNWGEYIADGSDGCEDLIEKFEAETGIRVIYETFDSNETMFAMMQSGASVYDIVIPSDYMIERLVSEDMLQKINFENIPNYRNIDPKYLNAYYDPLNEYSIPYNVGMCALVYNTEKISEEDVAKQSMDLLWNSRYTGDILTFDNARDGFGMAQAKLGIDFNSPYKSDWDRAYDELVKQKAVLQGYVMDSIFSKMEGESAFVGAYYAGDCLSMIDVNEKLSLYYPTEGTNVFVDAMCIPKCAQNVAAAEKFINFILEEENAVENALYLYYASPNLVVQNNDYYIEEMGENYDLLYTYPDAYLSEDGTLNTSIAQYYKDLSQVELLDDNGNKLGVSVLDYMTELWIYLKLE